MPEVKYFQKTLVFTDLVVDQNRAMQQLANPRPFSDGAPHAWETSQQLHMVEQRATKARSSLIVILGNVTDYAGEVV